MATAAAVRRMWAKLSPDFTADWISIKPQTLALIQDGRAAAAATATGYVEQTLRETNQEAPAVGIVSTPAFLRTAPDGRSMDTLLDEPIIWAKTHIKDGMTVEGALAQAGNTLVAATLTLLADTRRGIYHADIIQRPRVSGYVRMLNPPSCDRCVVLAGKWFRWNQGFLRHPRCDCQHIPATEQIAGDLTTDPYAYFQSLTKGQQDRTFGRIEARAIRDGGDIFRVINTRSRGLGTAKGAMRYGTPSRMTVDDIYRIAGTRTNAIRLLEREGYITGPQNAAGNILGQREGFGALGKGGRARAASDAVREARQTGRRDPLNRYTMTSAERRLYDAKHRLDVGRTGVMPRSIGANSADKNLPPTPITPKQLVQLETEYQREIAKIPTAPASVQRLAQLLGIT